MEAADRPRAFSFSADPNVADRQSSDLRRLCLVITHFTRMSSLQTTLGGNSNP
jgi:hypothetical protein